MGESQEHWACSGGASGYPARRGGGRGCRRGLAGAGRRTKGGVRAAVERIKGSLLYFCLIGPSATVCCQNLAFFPVVRVHNNHACPFHCASSTEKSRALLLAEGVRKGDGRVHSGQPQAAARAAQAPRTRAAAAADVRLCVFPGGLPGSAQGETPCKTLPPPHVRQMADMRSHIKLQSSMCIQGSAAQ